ncbi:hypothetical protein EPN90_04575 [Patescibacteria group bacterium]|nr:MAG: hypothetical protein EPN90_04575 [Patescibacteria group bacterium]
MQKYQYSLDLLRQVIGKAPRFFPSGRKTDMLDALAKLEREPGTTPKMIDDAIIVFGREIWPYRQAFWHIHDTDGRHDEDLYLREALAPELRAKYEAFLRKGLRVEDIRRGGEFEQYFSPVEKQALIDAKLLAHDRVVEGIETLCAGEKKAACDDALSRYREEQKKIEALIAELSSLAAKSEKWRSEILDKVRTFQAGWSGLERGVAAEDVKGEIDYYSGVVEVLE